MHCFTLAISAALLAYNLQDFFSLGKTSDSYLVNKFIENLYVRKCDNLTFKKSKQNGCFFRNEIVVLWSIEKQCIWTIKENCCSVDALRT